MAENLRLADLLPEQDTFTDEGTVGATGKTYPMRSMLDLDTSDQVTIERAQRRLVNLGGRSAPKNPQEQAQLLTDINKVMTDLLLFIVPDLPLERASAMPAQHKQAIFAWWQKRQPQAKAQPQQNGGPRGEHRGRGRHR